MLMVSSLSPAACAIMCLIGRAAVTAPGIRRVDSKIAVVVRPGPRRTLLRRLPIASAAASELIPE